MNRQPDPELKFQMNRNFNFLWEFYFFGGWNDYHIHILWIFDGHTPGPCFSATIVIFTISIQYLGHGGTGQCQA